MHAGIGNIPRIYLWLRGVPEELGRIILRSSPSPKWRSTGSLIESLYKFVNALYNKKMYHWFQVILSLHC